MRTTEKARRLTLRQVQEVVDEMYGPGVLTLTLTGRNLRWRVQGGRVSQSRQTGGVTVEVLWKRKQEVREWFELYGPLAAEAQEGR